MFSVAPVAVNAFVKCTHTIPPFSSRKFGMVTTFAATLPAVEQVPLSEADGREVENLQLEVAHLLASIAQVSVGIELSDVAVRGVGHLVSLLQQQGC